MKVKSYYSESVEAAIARASQELGPDAMLLSSRRTPPESRHLGEYEVVLALPEPENASFDAELGRAIKSEPAPGMDRLTREIADLRRQIERTASVFQKTTTLAGAPIAQSAPLLRIFSQLVSGDVDAELAHELVNACARESERRSEDVLHSEITRRIAVDPTLARTDGKPAVAAFIGPAGAGKTSALVKLAVQCGLARRKRVHLISLDTERIGGADQLRTFAALLGVGVDVLDDPCALEAALTGARNRDLILIDTPGGSGERVGQSQDLVRALAGIETHLVLPVSMKAADLRRAASAWSLFNPAKLLFTRLDETDTCGAILNEVVRTGCPVSFVSTGQLIPDDIQPADASTLAGLITGSRSLTSASAAAA